MNIVSTGQMRAQSLSVQVSNRERCNAGCKFCISRTTPGTDGDVGKVQKCDLGHFKRGLKYATRLGVTHLILTGKAEPTQEECNYLCSLIKESQPYIPLADMHTNGLVLEKNSYYLEDLVNAGLSMITFSIAHFDRKVNKYLMGIDVDYGALIKQAVEMGLLVRCSLVLCRQGISNVRETGEYIRRMGNFGAHMVVVRELWIPEFRRASGNKVYEWNAANKIPLHAVESEFSYITKLGEGNIRMLDPLPWGAKVYAMEGCFDDTEHGVNITFAKCEENARGPVLKSIVHKPNGHGYRNWDSNANILY